MKRFLRPSTATVDELPGGTLFQLCNSYVSPLPFCFDFTKKLKWKHEREQKFRFSDDVTCRDTFMDFRGTVSI